MTELIADLPYRVRDAARGEYYASVAGEQRPDGTWEAWLEYVPTDDSEPLLTPTETTQATRADVVAWAQALTSTYIEGAFARAVDAAGMPPRLTVRRAIADAVAATMEGPDPFALFALGQTTMRARLAALPRATLLDVIATYGLNPARKSLAWLTTSQLVTFIVTAVEVQVASGKRPS